MERTIAQMPRGWLATCAQNCPSSRDSFGRSETPSRCVRAARDARGMGGSPIVPVVPAGAMDCWSHLRRL